MSRAQLKKSPLSSLNTIQAAAVEEILHRDHTLLVADKGLGKTRIGLAAGWESGGRVLVACPQKVIPGWLAEAEKLGIREDVVALTGSQRARETLLGTAPADCIMVMSADLLDWLCRRKHFPFNAYILDETTRYATPGNVATKRLRNVAGKMDWTLGMTAHPVMERPDMLYGQCLVIDGGKALGRSVERFREQFLFPADFQARRWKLQPGGAERLAAAVAELVLTVEDLDYEDSLPDLDEVPVLLEMPPDAWKQYCAMADEALVEAGGEEIEAVNEAVMSGKLEQICQGAVYGTGEAAHWLHSVKMDWIVEQAQASPEPVVIAYQYNYELDYLRRALPDAVLLKDWDRKSRFDMLLMQFRSGSHGLDGLQDWCCEMLCTKPIWSADGWTQLGGRLRRRGQTRPCRRRVAVMANTVDEIILERLGLKEDTGTSLLGHIKAAAARQ